MLAPDSRILLLDQLAPPPGLRFDSALATTFTLDLTATLLPTLAFTGFHLGGGLTDPIATLESVRSTADKIDVFCQAGAIGVPEKAPDLLAFLEPMVHPVRPPGAGLFHPKVWFIKYVDEDDTPSFRLLVLTRNLTMDASWDLAVRLDSERLADRRQTSSSALQEFLESLPPRGTRRLSETRMARIAELAEQAGRVVWERPSWAEDVLLHFLDRGRKQTMNFAGSRHLVVSPFVDDQGLSLVRSNGRIQILSRPEELEKLDPTTAARLDARILDDLAVVQEVEGSRLGGQLHAKMYVVEQTKNWSKSHVFIGSANATGAGLNTNTEFMVELRGNKKHFGIDRFLGGDGTFMALTEPYDPTGTAEQNPEDLAERELENALRRLASAPYVVAVRPPVDPAAGVYDLHLRAAGPLGLDPGWSATAELLTLADHAAPISAAGGLDALVPNVATGDISPFLAIRIESPGGLRASTVVVAELIDPPEDRLDVVLARQIDTPEKFLRFLFFLLSLGNPAALAHLAANSPGDGPGGSPFGSGGSGILEMVLGALATRPAALSDLDALVLRLASTEDGRRSLPDGFLEFWDVVRQAGGFDAEAAE